jgi:small conductance mechanosensitive channel
MEMLNNLFVKGLEFVSNFGPKVLMTIAIFIIGLIVIKLIVSSVGKALKHSKMDTSLRHFLESLVGIILKVLLVIYVISYLGVETTSFVAILAAAGFAIGMALQGSLSNFAGGVMILLFKPFKVGHFIEAQGFSGSVKKIEIFNTLLTTGDNKRIIIPNGKLSNDSIVNYSIEENRRVDMVFGIGYDDDIKKTKELLEKIVKADKRVLDNPGNLVAVGELADSSVNFKVRAWVKSGDYWGVYHDMQETVKLEFDKAGISIPYPQMDVHSKK